MATRTLEITQSTDGPVLVTTEIPSGQFDSFGHSGIAEVGRLLDDKLARLLEQLGAVPPIELQQ